VASQEVFFVDANQNVQELWSWSTAAPEWHSSDVSMAAGDPTQATAGSPLTADINATVSPATDELYYVGVDGLVHEMWWNGSWHPGTP
jgi:hypothetical protein